MSLWQIYKYNDVNKNSRLAKGQRIYLKPKRRRAKEDVHLVKMGETMYSISQLHAIKLKFLFRKNRMEEGQEPKIGQKLSLRKKISKTP